MTFVKTTEDFKRNVMRDIRSDPEGILIFDIQLRYGSIESDIIALAQEYGFDPQWSDDEQEIIDTESNPDNHIEFIYETSQKAEDYLNDLLSLVGIKGWSFYRIPEGEIWGLWPDDLESED